VAWLQRLDAQVVPQGAAVWEELRASDAKRAPDAATPLVARLPPPGLNRHNLDRFKFRAVSRFRVALAVT
jgi:hypothetical protein